MNKNILYCMYLLLLSCNSITYSSDEYDINTYKDFKIEDYENLDPQELIKKIEDFIEKLQTKIIKLKNELSTLRLNGGGKGNYNPIYQKKAQAIIQEIHIIDQQIRILKSKILLLAQ